MRSGIREIAIFGISAGLMFALQVAMGPLPNIEPVSLMILVMSLVFGLKALWSVLVFVLLEGLMYGFGLWWFFYLYAWPLLVVITALLKNKIRESSLGCALLSGAYGLFFGFLYALIFLFSGGFSAFWTCWVAGIMFDIVHCVANFALAFVLADPLVRLLEKCRNRRYA